MKVSGTKSGGTVSSSKKGKAAPSRGSEFGRFLAEASEVSDTAAVSDVARATGVGSILATQETDASDERQARRQVIRRSHDILDRLDEIRQGLLQGTLSKERLMTLAQMLRAKRPLVSDPELSQLLDEIELRAQVEIAKLTR